jgi:predicted negative regulator of RcsB-dependent stress response
MLAVGVLLMWEAWQSHKTGQAPTPIVHATKVVQSAAAAKTG